MRALPLAALLAALCLGACKENGPKTVEGVVFDASMHNISVITDRGDTLDFFIGGLDRSVYPGVLLEDSVSVTYRRETIEGARVLRPTRVRITVHSPYYYIQGAWVEPDPIDPAREQGFELRTDGTAASIGMATLQFESWEFDGGSQLILQSRSIGNGRTIEGSDTLRVDKLDADSLVLSQGGQVVWRLARQR